MAVSAVDEILEYEEIARDVNIFINFILTGTDEIKKGF